MVTDITFKIENFIKEDLKSLANLENISLDELMIKISKNYILEKKNEIENEKELILDAYESFEDYKKTGKFFTEEEVFSFLKK